MLSLLKDIKEFVTMQLLISPNDARVSIGSYWDFSDLIKMSG